MHPKQGTDAAVAMAMGHVILKEFYFPDEGRERSAYFDDYVRRYTDMPMLVMLKEHTLPSGEKVMVPDRYVRASDFNGKLGQANNPEWKTVAFDASGKVVLPNGAIGFRWGPDGRADQGQWNLEAKEARARRRREAQAVGAGGRRREQRNGEGRFPVLRRHRQRAFPEQRTQGRQRDVLVRTVPVQRLALGKEGEEREALVATVFDLQVANYGIARGLPGELAAKSFDDDTPYTPAWQERITGTPRAQVITVARQFAENAHKTQGRSMVIIGAAMNHWYHCDMNYRGIINMLMLCGCIGKSGGGWAHYVGQEKLRPQTGWTALAFALDWIRPPRQQNSTSFFYAHTDQWRYEKLKMDEVISPLADARLYGGSMIDYNVRAERMGWLPSAPQLRTNPLQVVRDAQAAGVDPKDYVVKGLKDGTLAMSCEDPDHPSNWPRNLFVWRSNLLGSSGKGHEYFLKHLLGTSNGVQGKDLGRRRPSPTEVVWHDQAPEGKLDLLVTLDFRMSTTCLYSDIVLPTASWYEKNDLNTSDMHPFIHPLSTAVDPAWQSRSDWEIYKGFAKKFSEVCVGHLGVETRGRADAADARHAGRARAAVRGQGVEARRGRPHPGQDGTADRGRRARLSERVQAVYRARPADGQGRQRRQGHRLEHADRGEATGRAERRRERRRRDPRHAAHRDRHRRLRGDPAAGTRDQRSRRGQGVGGARQDHRPRARASRALPRGREDPLPRRAGAAAQDHQLAHLERHRERDGLVQRRLHQRARADPLAHADRAPAVLQDHPWMIAFGEGFSSYRPPVDLKTTAGIHNIKPNGNPEILLNFITPHQKWGIHSHLQRQPDDADAEPRRAGASGCREDDAKSAGIVDNDWVELFNINGAIAARAVVSQRVNPGMVMMYHAQEKIVNTPGSEITGVRGGIHNSVTRIVLKPTHMIGGYAQFSYGFNYYGTIGTNRDEFVVVRKMDKVDWLDTPRDDRNCPFPRRRREKAHEESAHRSAWC